MVVRLTIAPSRLRTEILLSARRKLGTASPAGISTSLTIAGGTAAATSDDGSIGASGSATRRAVAPATGIAALSPRTKRSAASRSVIMFAGGGCRRLRVGFLGGTLGLLPGLSEYENFIDERLDLGRRGARRRVGRGAHPHPERFLVGDSIGELA